jgi:carbamoyltransferase
MKRIAPGAVHVDGTARPQIIEYHTNPSYYTILEKYDELTNRKSVLINTSFNMHGEPIVNTPEDAIKSFIASQLDVLVLNDFIVTQK